MGNAPGSGQQKRYVPSVFAGSEKDKRMHGVVQSTPTQSQGGERRIALPAPRAPAKEYIQAEKEHTKAGQGANRLAERRGTQIALTYDDRMHQIITRVMRTRTGEVIGQLSPEEMVESTAALREDVRRLLMDRTG
jgi:uncharacterized FlaG/YvyC family protein